MRLSSKNSLRPSQNFEPFFRSESPSPFTVTLAKLHFSNHPTAA